MWSSQTRRNVHATRLYHRRSPLQAYSEWMCNASVTADSRPKSGGIKQQLVGITRFIFGQRIQRALENAEGVGGSFAEREQDAHQGFTGPSALLGLRTEADLAGNDQWTQLAFGAVVVGGDGGLLGPMIEAGCFLPEGVLDCLNGRMLRRCMNQGLDVHFEFQGALAKRRRRQPLGAQLDGVGQQRSEAGDKLQHLTDLWKLLAQILDLAQQVGVAILNQTGCLIVPVVTIHHQSPRQSLGSEHFLGHAGRTALAKTKEADPFRAKEPRIT